MSGREIINIILTFVVGISIYNILLIITMNRNVKKVVKIFEEKNALSAKTAINGIRLGIRQQSASERAFKKRDNRALALNFLFTGGVVSVTDDQRYYLDKNRMIAYKEELNFIASMMIPNIYN